MLSSLFRVHDEVTRFGAFLAAACIGTIVFSFCFEVASRHFFHSPTVWANAVSTYLLLFAVMLVFPYITMNREHILMNFLPDSFRGRYRVVYYKFLLLLTLATCLLAAWFCLSDTIKAFSRGLRTSDIMGIPRWWLSAAMVYGFVNSSLHMVRQMAAPVPASSE